jgi:hypothetical protein
MITALLMAAFAADVTVTLSPEPMAVTEAVYGRVRGVGTWTATICNDADDRVTVSAARIYAAAAVSGQLKPIGRSRILVMLDRARYERRASRVARFIDYGLMGATAFGAVQGVDMTALKYMALTMPIARQAADRLKERVPTFDAVELLDGEIALEGGVCTSRVMFSGTVKGARVVVLPLTVRRRPVAATITSIPEAP